MMARAARQVPYLVERDGRYWARVVVPADVRSVFGKRELREPLGADRRDAIRNLHLHVTRFLDDITAARRKVGASIPSRITRPLSSAAMAHLYYREELATDERDRLHPEIARLRPGYAELFEGRHSAFLRRIAAGQLDDDEVQAILGWAIDKFQERGNTKVERGTPDWRDLARTLALVELEVIGRRTERDRGDYAGEPRLPMLKEAPADLDAPAPVPLLDLLDAYLVERGKLGKGIEARRRWTPVFRQFIAFLKHDDAEAVTPEKAEEWLTDVLGRKAAKTVRDTDLGSLKAVYRWALRRKRVTHNPFADVSLDAPKVHRTREKGFTDDEAKALLKAARNYQPAVSANPRTREAAPTTAAKRWVPWLCALTGARVAEITQLRREDFREQGGIQFLRITPDAGSVKTGAYRDVPLHPQLVELGLLEFVEGVASGPLFYVPSPRKAGAQHPAKQVAQRLAFWVRSLDVIGEVDPSHGWRHRFKTVARDAGLDGRIVDAVQGHASRTAGESYGDVSLRAMSRVIERLPAYALS